MGMKMLRVPSTQKYKTHDQVAIGVSSVTEQATADSSIDLLGNLVKIARRTDGFVWWWVYSVNMRRGYTITTAGKKPQRNA